MTTPGIVSSRAMSMVDTDAARTLLDRIPQLQRPCDLDLLTFFARHPRTLVSNEQLGQLMGYQLNEVARSRDVLIAAGWLTRTESPTRRPPLYVFEAGGADGKLLSALVALATTRDGRLALRRVLARVPAGAADRLPMRPGDEAKAPSGAGRGWAGTGAIVREWQADEQPRRNP
jgi:hypothetical protein